MVAKGNSRIGMIKRTFSKLQPNGFKMLYKALVRPILEYCSCIWNPLLIGDQREIEKVQRRATKLIPGLKNKTYSQRLKALNMTTLFYRRKRAEIIQVFRIVRQIDRIPFEQFFTYSTNDNTRGHKYKLEKPRAKTPMRLNGFSHRVITLWNNLPEEAVNCTKINPFKTALEKAWKKDPCKYVFADDEPDEWD